MKRTVFPSNKDLLAIMLKCEHEASPLKPKLIDMSSSLGESSDDADSIEKNSSKDRENLKNLAHTYKYNGVMKRRIDLIHKNSTTMS